jgi:hypothetical protein
MLSLKLAAGLGTPVGSRLVCSFRAGGTDDQEKSGDERAHVCLLAESDRLIIPMAMRSSATITCRQQASQRSRCSSMRANRRPFSKPNLIILARLTRDAGGILDYYVFPGGFKKPIQIFEQNPYAIDLHRFADLSFLDLLFRQSRLEAVA